MPPVPIHPHAIGIPHPRLDMLVVIVIVIGGNKVILDVQGLAAAAGAKVDRDDPMRDGDAIGWTGRDGPQTLYEHGRHVFNLQSLHSKMNQCGPE